LTVIVRGVVRAGATTAVVLLAVDSAPTAAAGFAMVMGLCAVETVDAVGAVDAVDTASASTARIVSAVLLAGKTAPTTAMGSVTPAIGGDGQGAPTHGTAVGGAVALSVIVIPAAAEAVGLTVILIHHTRLLSRRQAQPSAVKPPSPPRGRSSSVNRVPRFRAVAGSYRARNVWQGA
jgi:hypothetical protein